MALFNYEILQGIKLEESEKYDFLISSIKSSIDEENYKKIESSDDQFDIFLSHSYQDKEIIPHLKKTLENLGFRVYVDWINDKFFSREDVDKKIAALLQKRMNQSKSLFYATSQNSKNSKWMPWELGYFDGKNGKVAILPVLKTLNDEFKGQEYLGLYDYITKDHLNKLFISNRKNPIKNGFFRDILSKTNFNDWLNQ